VRFDHVAVQVPDIDEAVDWYAGAIPGTRVLYQDRTWALVDAGGARVAFVLADQHPGHLAFRVEPAELERLAAEHGRTIDVHRDASRGFYLDAPGDHVVEIIAYPVERS
jgi:catechol 2,3-dioxygenase-like lactoylglutathione lyase family enzyme